MLHRFSRRAWLTMAMTLPAAGTIAQTQQLSSATPAAADPAQLPDQEIGRRFSVKPEDLPSPYTKPIVASRPLTVPHAGQVPRVPQGFTVTLFASGLAHPRRMLVLPNGDVILAEQKVGYLTLLRDHDGDGKADWIERHAEGFNGPYGLAWRDGDVLVADQDGIWKVPHRDGALRPGRSSEQKAADVPPEQRKRVILIGVIAALVLRIAFALVVSQLLQIVGLILAGGLLLLWVAWKMWRELKHSGDSAGSPEIEGDEHSGLTPAKSFASAAWAVAVADVSMSLDNVLAVAGAARDHPGILIVGLVFAVALMGVAANLIAKYIERYRWIAYIGLAVIVWVAGKMIWDGFHDVAPHLARFVG